MPRAKSMSLNPVRPATEPPANDQPLADAAEEVRSFFVTARGGAPFLSGADGEQLVRWLEAGQTVSALLRAIEATATRRAARRSRAPFTLRSIGPALKTPAAHAPPSRRPAVASDGGAPHLPAPADDILRSPLCPDADVLAADARAALSARAQRDPEERAREGCRIVRAFQERLWAVIGPELPALRTEATRALAEARDEVDMELFDAMCDEWVRARLRERYPDLTATRVWEEANDAG
jgi:hypothetical protein